MPISLPLSQQQADSSKTSKHYLSVLIRRDQQQHNLLRSPIRPSASLPLITTHKPPTTSPHQLNHQNGCRCIMREPSKPHLPHFRTPLTSDPKIQITSIFRTIGACLMAIVNGIGAVLQAIIGAIVSLFDIIISCLTCGRGGGRRRGGRRVI